MFKLRIPPECDGWMSLRGKTGEDSMKKINIFA